MMKSWRNLLRRTVKARRGISAPLLISRRPVLMCGCSEVLTRSWLGKGLQR